MKRSIDWINVAYLFLVVGVVLWFGITHQNNLKFWEKEKRDLQLQIEELNKKNIALFEENIQLKNHIEIYNNTNFNLLTSLINQYSQLKDENIALKEQNIKVKKDLTTATTNDKHIIMKIESN